MFKELVVTVPRLTALETSEEDVDKTTLKTSEDFVDKTTLETSKYLDGRIIVTERPL